jgi:N-methylhydantoinase A
MPRLGIDVGGTFVDLVLATEDDTLFFEKVLAEPGDLVGSILGGVDAVLGHAGIAGGDVAEVVHATTRGSNTVLERSGPVTALVVTRGFRDVLQIQRALRWSMYDVQLEKPVPLVPRSRSFEVTERTLADGSVLVPLAEPEVTQVAAEIRRVGATAVAVAFLHSYANPDHERRAVELLAAALPEATVTASSDTSLQAREYERANTAVVNAYIAGAVSDYLSELVEALPSAGVHAPVWIMQSSGGLASVTQAVARPVRTLESGPAAGVVGATSFGAAVGHEDVISFDMGGTTAKAAVVSGGVPATTSYFELMRIESRRGSGLPVDIPALDLVEIGTGGGSIAEVRDGTLRVGPRSAGADPGPACYGRGGRQATVTDANLVLGYYDPSVFAGGVVLDVAAAENAIDRLAAELGLDRLRAAWGIHEVATLDMEHAIRLVSINRGFDPREHALVCTGGAAPAHGPRLARALGATVAVVPLAASGGSARGLLEASESTEVTLSALVPLAADDAHERCTSTVRALLDEADRGAFGAFGGGEVRLALGMRYTGQGYELLLPIAGAGDVPAPDALVEAFHRRYERAYGYRDADGPVEVVTWHASLVRLGRVGASRETPDAPSTTPDAHDRRRVFFPETGSLEVSVYIRELLRPGDRFHGPCVIAEPTTTSVVLPDDRVEVAPDGTMLIHVGAAL